MAKQVNINGIVRNTSAQNCVDGSCEEIINMRLDSGAWRVVGKKKMIIDGAGYEKVYVHKYGTFENFIGVKSWKCFWFASMKDGVVESRNQEICEVDTGVAFSSITNILLIRDRWNINKLLFSEGRYNLTTSTLPDIPLIETKFKIKAYNSDKAYTKLNFYTNNVDSVKAAKEMIRGLIVKENEDDALYTEGYVLLCTTYELFDGSETKFSPPVLIKLSWYVPGAIGAESEPKHDTDTNMTADVRVADLKLMSLSVRVKSPVDERFADMIKKINVYVTPARSFYDFDSIDPTKVVIESAAGGSPVIKEKPFGDVEKMLFFKAFDVDALSPTKSYTEVRFDSALVTNRTMPVDASGWLNTTGDMFVYNMRLHLYNLQQKFVNSENIKKYLIVESDEAATDDLALVFYIKNTQGTSLVRIDVRAFRVEADVYAINDFITFPDSRCVKIEVYHALYFTTKPGVIAMSPSDAYNFSFCYNKRTTVDVVVDVSKPANVPVIDNLILDNAKVIVSEAFNPYFFSPKHSYLMPGEIINLAVNTEQLSASQVGQFPLYAFTTEGICALQSGDGSILYSNVIPVSAEVAVKGSDVLQTKYGVVFATDKGLKVIAGNEVVDFSEPVNGPLDGNIREAETYAGATDNPGMGVEVAKYLSRVPFREYVREAVMGYDISEDEVIVSNPEYDYSYVFSLKTKTWHKISEVFSDLNRHVALKEYMAGAVAAQAVLRVECTVRPGRVVTFTKSATLRDMTFSMGYVSVTLEIQGAALPPFTCPTDTPVSLYDVIRAMNIPEEFLKVLEGEGKVFSAIYTGLRVVSETEGVDEHFVFVQDVRVITVGGIGEGEVFSVMLGSRKLTHTTVGTDTTRSIANMIAAWALDGGFTARAHSLGVDIGANPGAEGNRTLFSFVSSEHVELSSEGFSGGADTQRSRQVCDIRQEEECVQPVYLQTRPLNLDFYGFKKVSHYVLRGELRPAADRGFYGVFMFASNDLMHWECVADGGIKADVPHVLFSRLFHSFRYFVVMAGGYVRPGHVVTHAEIEGEPKYDNRLR